MFSVFFAEFVKTLGELCHVIFSGTNDHSEVARLKEALTGEGQTVLLNQQLLAEVDVILDVFEMVHFNFAHQIHGSCTLDRSHTFDLAHKFKCVLRGSSKLVLKSLKVAFRHFTEDLRQSSLHQRVRVEQNHLLLRHSLEDIIKVAVFIIYNIPATTPARQAVNFRNRSSSDHRNVFAKVSKGVELGVLVIIKSVVHFISDDRNLVLVTDSKDFKHVLFRPASATGIAWVVKQDSFDLGSDYGLELSNIDVPVLLRVKLVVLKVNVKVLADSLDEGETRTGHQNCVTLVTQN